MRTAEILANDALDSDNIRDNKANSDLLEKWIRGLVRPGYIGFFLRLSDEGRRAAIDGIECHHDILTHWTADYTVERQLVSDVPPPRATGVWKDLTERLATNSLEGVQSSSPRPM